jgi:hypothetical protein
MPFAQQTVQPKAWWMAQQMARRPEQLTARATAHGMTRLAVQTMGRS